MEVIGGQDKKRQMDKNNSVNTNAATSAWLAFFSLASWEAKHYYPNYT